MSIEEFLKQSEIQQLLEEENLHDIYGQWPGLSKYLTDFFYEIGVNPLDYMMVIFYEMYQGFDFEEFNIPPHITRIGGGAFSYCKKLRYIEIPSSIERIAPTVFYGCTNKLVIHCKENSVAHEYAIDNNIKFELI